jgi:hypothetical protein
VEDDGASDPDAGDSLPTVSNAKKNFTDEVSNIMQQPIQQAKSILLLYVVMLLRIFYPLDLPTEMRSLVVVSASGKGQHPASPCMR